MTKADQAHRAAEETAAYFGQDNLEQLGEVYQAFVQKVDVRALLAWKLPDGLDELLLPVFRAALLTIAGELRLGEVVEQLDERDQLRAENERLKAEIAKRNRSGPKTKPVRQYRFPGDAMSAPHDEPQRKEPGMVTDQDVPRAQRLCATPIEVINADETTGTIRIVVVGWSIDEHLTARLGQFTMETGLDAEGLVDAQWLEADVNIHAARAEDLRFQDIAVAPELPAGFMGTAATNIDHDGDHA